MTAPLIGQIIPVHTSYHHVIQTPRSNCLRHIPWLIGVRWRRSARSLHIAESAASGACVAEDHDGGRGGPRLAAGPALAQIRALGLLADRVELQFPQLLLDLHVLLAPGDRLRHPLGLRQRLLLGADLHGVGVARLQADEVGERRGLRREPRAEPRQGLGGGLGRRRRRRRLGGGGGEGGEEGEAAARAEEGLEARLHCEGFGSIPVSLSSCCGRNRAS